MNKHSQTKKREETYWAGVCVGADPSSYTGCGSTGSLHLTPVCTEDRLYGWSEDKRLICPLMFNIVSDKCCNFL